MSSTDPNTRELQSRFLADERAALLQRAPLAAAVMLAAYGAFAVGDWFLSPTDVRTLWGIKLTAAATLSVMTLLLWTAPGRRFVGGLCVLGAYVGLGSIVVQSNMIGDSAVVPTVATFGSLVLSAMLPWRVVHQSWFVAAVLVALQRNAVAVNAGEIGYAVTAAGICSMASVPLTYYFSRVRFDLWRARVELEESHGALQESEERFRQVAENSKDIIWIWNHDFSIDYVSPAIAAIPGWSPERLIAEPAAILDLVHPQDRRAVAQTLQRVHDGETTEEEARLIGSVGDDGRWFKGWGGPVRDTSGNILRFVGIWHDIHSRKVAEAEMRAARERSDELLRNVFPGSIADRVKTEGARSIADGLPDVTILFADVVGFTPLAERLGPKKLLDVMNDLFSRFDDLAESMGVEKIETIGDGYLAAGGAPTDLEDHPQWVARLALAMIEAATTGAACGHALEVRIGIHTGPVVGGVIGRKRLHYGLFGETINVSSRLQSSSAPSRVLVSDSTCKRLESEFSLTPNDTIELKGHGPMRTWWLDAEIAKSPAVARKAPGANS